MRILVSLVVLLVLSSVSLVPAGAATIQEYMDWGYDQFKHGDYDESIKNFNNALAQNPDYAEAYGQRAFAKQILKDNQGALDDLKKAAKLDPANTTYKTSLQNLQKQFDKYSADIKIANSLIKSNDQNTSAYLQRGVAKEFLGDYNGAIADYKKIAEITPNDWFAYTKLADAEYQIGKYDDAIKHYSQVLNIKTAAKLERSDDFYKRGLVYKNLKQYNLAVNDFNNATATTLDTKKQYNAYIQIGLTYSLAGDYQSAIDEGFGHVNVNIYGNADGPNYVLYLYTGIALHYAGRNDYTLKDINMVLESYPSNKYAHNILGLIYQKQGNYSSAVADFDMAIKLDPDYKEAIKNREIALVYTKPYTDYVESGNKYMGDGNYMKAVVEYNKAIMVNPSIPNLYVLRGNAEQNYGDYEKAIADYTQSNLNEGENSKKELIAQITQNADRYMEAGNKAYSTKNYAQAISEYGKSIYLSPSFSAYRSRGDAKYAYGDYEGALSDYNKANELNPNYDIFYNRGRAKLALADYQGAIEDLDKSIQKDAKFAAAYENRGIAKSSMGNYKDAIADLDKAISLNANRASAYFNRANTKKAMNNFKGAVADYTKAIELNTANLAVAYNLRGFTKYFSGDESGAIDDYEKAISIDPNYAEAYFNLGRCYKFLKDYDSAVANLDKAISIDATYENAFYNRAIVKGVQKKYDEAVADYTSVIALNPKNPQAYKERGDIKEQNNDYRGAISDWEKAVELNPALSAKLQGKINKAKEDM